MKDFSFTITSKDGTLDVTTEGGVHKDCTMIELLANPEGYRLVIGALNKERKAEVLGLNELLADKAQSGSYM